MERRKMERRKEARCYLEPTQKRRNVDKRKHAVNMFAEAKSVRDAVQKGMEKAQMFVVGIKVQHSMCEAATRNGRLPSLVLL